MGIAGLRHWVGLNMSCGVRVREYWWWELLFETDAVMRGIQNSISYYTTIHTGCIALTETKNKKQIRMEGSGKSILTRGYRYCMT